MSARDDGGPAFPEKEPLSNDWPGMSLRDYFAAKAMQELLSQEQFDSLTETAISAYQMADAMLKVRVL